VIAIGLLRAYLDEYDCKVLSKIVKDIGKHHQKELDELRSQLKDAEDMLNDLWEQHPCKTCNHWDADACKKCFSKNKKLFFDAYREEWGDK